MAGTKRPDRALVALLAIEPELREIQSVALVLQALAETADALDPMALLVLARALNRSAGQIEVSWRSGLRDSG